MSERCFKQHGWVQVMIFSKGLFVVSPWIFVFNLQLTPEGIIFKWKIYEKGVVVIISRGFKAEERTSTQITCKVAEHEHVNVPSRIKEGLKAPKATIWRWEYVANSKVSKTDSSCSYDQGAIHVRNVVECIIWHCKIHLKRIQNKHWIYKIYHEFHTKYLSIYIYCIYKYMYQCINNKNRNKNNNLQTHIMITKKLPQKIFFAQIPLDSSSYQWPCSDSSSRPWSLRRVSGSQRSLHSQRKTRRWRPNCLRGNFREKTVGRYL